jgi:winged helix-turn-helix DNA-binding protein
VPRKKNSAKPAPPPAPPAPRQAAPPSWTFLSNHTHVLICLAQNPEMLLREVAQRVGITERGVQKIVQELEQAGTLVRHRQGRRNTYVIHADVPLRHPVEAHRSVEHLLAAVLTPAELARLKRN